MDEDERLRTILKNSLISLGHDTKQKLLHFTIYQIVKSSMIEEGNTSSLSEEKLLFLIKNFLENLNAIEDPSETSLDQIVTQLKSQIYSIHKKEADTAIPVKKRRTFAEIYGMIATEHSVSEDEIKSVHINATQVTKNI